MELSNRTNSGTSFLGKYIELVNDVDFNNIKSYEKADRTDFGDVNNNGIVESLRTELTTGEGFPCIGKMESKAFAGNFLGDNCEIKKIYINRLEDYQALFGYNKGTIKEVNINGQIKGLNYVGSICGSNYGTIESCKNNDTTVTGTIVGAYSSSNRNWSFSWVGGIVGKNTNDATVINCCNKGKVNIDLGTNTSGNSYNGGIAGGNLPNAKISNCYNISDL